MRRQVCSLILIGLGSAVILLSLSAYYLVGYVTNQQIAHQIVIDSPQHPQYESQFLTNAYEGAPPKYNRIFLFHITNVASFLNGTEEPIFEERGPYVFRETYKRQNVTFSDDKEQVTYAETIQNTFVPDLSKGGLDDQVTIINLPYVKVMSKFGAESKLILAGGTQVLPTVFTELQNLMVPAVINGAVAKGIETAFNSFALLNMGKGNLLSKMGGACKDPKCITTTPFLSKYRPIIDPAICHCEACECSSQTIQANMMSKIVSSDDEYGILNVNTDQGINYWLSFYDGNETTVNTLKVRFNLNDYQVTKLQSWLYNVSQSEIIRSGVFDKLNIRSVPKEDRISDWTDIPFRQVLRADVLSLLLNNSAFPQSVQPAAPPELPFFVQWSKTAKLKFNATSAEINSEVANWNLSTLKCINSVLKSNTNQGIYDLLGLTVSRPGKAEDFLHQSLDNLPSNKTWADCFKNPLMGVNVLRSYVQYSAETVLQDRFANVVNNNGGLVITRSVKQHVLGMPEPLLQVVLEPSDPRYKTHAILSNDPSLDAEPLCISSADVENDYTSCKQVRSVTATGKVVKRYVRASSTYYTGVNHLDRTGQYVNVHGNSSLDNIFVGGSLQFTGGAQDIRGSIQYGYSNGMAFPPMNSLKNDSVLAVYVPSLAVPLLFSYIQEVNDLYGLKLSRFAVRRDQFSWSRPDADMYSMYQFLTPDGLLNVTEPKGFPVFVSTPNYYGYDNGLDDNYSILVDNSTVLTNITNMINARQGSFEKYWSFFDIEPNTGKTMRALIRGQVVISLKDTEFDIFYPNVMRPDYVPVYWKEVSGQVSEPLAQQVKLVYAVEDGTFYGSIAGYVIGAGLLISGVVMLVLVRRGKNQMYFPAEEF